MLQFSNIGVWKLFLKNCDVILFKTILYKQILNPLLLFHSLHLFLEMMKAESDLQLFRVLIDLLCKKLSQHHSDIPLLSLSLFLSKASRVTVFIPVHSPRTNTKHPWKIKRFRPEEFARLFFFPPEFI